MNQHIACLCNQDMFIYVRFQCKCGHWWEDLRNADWFCPVHGEDISPDYVEVDVCKMCRSDDPSGEEVNR
jgi:hypothetical protein